MNEYTELLIARFKIELEKKDRSGAYGYTQRKLAYNSNRIEGSTLTEKQTSSLFETGTVNSNNDIIKSKDIEEMNGHFVMFNNMLKTFDQELTEDLIKSYHYDLKSGVFEDKANGYAVGDYKTRANVVSDLKTVLPSEVASEMRKLLEWYNKVETKTLDILADFHARYERIHPFQDGNGRTGRIILFKECLKNNLMPFIIEDDDKAKYYNVLRKAQDGNIKELSDLFKYEQEKYFNNIKDFIEEA